VCIVASVAALPTAGVGSSIVVEASIVESTWVVASPMVEFDSSTVVVANLAVEGSI
jgi:hypothetical protein